MHTKFPYVKRRIYPHLKPNDKAIWDRFIEKYPDAYDYVYYDLALGTGPDFDTVVDTETGGDVRDLYRWKIDVVGVKGSRKDIIEVKPRAGVSAIGQAACYRLLWRRDMDPEKDDRAVIVTDELRPDMRFLAHRLGVVLIVV